MLDPSTRPSAYSFGENAARELDIRIPCGGQRSDERDCNEKIKCVISADPQYFYTNALKSMFGGASKAKQRIGRRPHAYFDERVTKLMREDLKAAEHGEVVETPRYRMVDHHE